MLKVSKDVRAILDDSGLPWHVENGSRHWLLYVDGAMVTIIPHGHSNNMKFATRNTLCHVRRHIRERQQEMK